MRQIVFLGTLLLAACSSPTEIKKTVQTPVVSVKNDTAKDGSDKRPRVREKRARNEAPNGDVANIVIPGNRVEIVDKTKFKRTLEPDTLHPPAGERGLIGISAQTTTYLDDGTLLVGVGDGTLVAIDGSDNPKWSIGFRGSIAAIVPADENRVIVTTLRGVIASVNATNGQVLWEKHLVASVLSPAVIGSDDHIYVASTRGVHAFAEDGSVVFSHAVNLSDDICCAVNPKDVFAVDASGHITARGLDIRVSDPHPPILDTTSTYLLDYEKVLDEKVANVLASGPDELLLLVAGKKGRELVRYSGGKANHFTIPSQASKADRLGEDKPVKPKLQIDDIALGPNGNPWILARAIFPLDPEDAMPWMSHPAKGMLLELAGTSVRERNDIKNTFDETWLSTYWDSHIRAPENGKARLFCFGSEPAACALYDGAQAEILPRKIKTNGIFNVGKNTYVVNDSGPVERLEGKRLVPIPMPKDETYSISAIGGTGDDDLWFTNSGSIAYHWDGKTFTPMSVPQSLADGVVARTPTDAWSRNGLVHWDGKRWTSVAGTEAAGGIVLRGSNEVWVGNRHGLFRGKATQRAHVRLPDAKSVDTKPLDAPKVLTLGPSTQGYLASKTSLIMKNAPAVSTAKRVEVARDGTLWVEAWDQLVEVDAEGKTTVIDKDEQHITFERWFYPEGPGRGIFTHRDRESEDYNSRDQLRQFADGKAAESAAQLDAHDIMAISGNAAGATWILGSVEAGSPYSLRGSIGAELSTHALMRVDEKSAFQTVVGLPALAYRDVSVTPEAGGFFVGALNAGPVGEGFLLHARGRSGTESVTRYRASATLFSVAAVSNDEAWAVGAMGQILHVKGNVIERQVLPSGAWLRAVIATAPYDIWIAGDDGTLLHGDGSTFRPVPHSLGTHAAFSGLAVSRGIVWAVSPSGILRITNTGKTMPI